MLPSLQIAGCSVLLGDFDNGTVIVKVYEAPDKMPDTMIIGCSSVYGWCDKISSLSSNGIRTVCIHLMKPIPSAAYSRAPAVGVV